MDMRLLRKPCEFRNTPAAWAAYCDSIKTELGAWNASLKAAGYAEPGKDFGKWQQLARIVGVDPEHTSLKVIVEYALAFIERERVKGKIKLT